ncbi:universal stress protein [Telmatospirillum sp.]|uniref:universal stress protein n=1 Tax=Telmatospirillum sp. TaxID=2079197 RepID=UPI00283AF538|nr:universal stress protein [Telmatospirillum sp.]MDR3441178.1 universal stress protein [Telmatospirillum sp.]
MTGYKTILTCLCDAETAPATLGLALLIGRDHAAHVEALHVKIDPASAVPLVGEGMSGAMVEEMLGVAERQATERSAGIRQLFEQMCTSQGIPLTTKPQEPATLTAAWREEVGREEEVIAEAGRLTDLLVIARPSLERDIPSVMSLNAALLESGRPLMLAPPKLATSVGRNIAIFWNGSVEAARAVAAALPFLQKAQTVTILSAREEAEASPGELAAYLAWHGVTASEHAFAAGGSGGTQVAQTLLDEAVTRGADLIVMGAYTHSRLRQLILGGVTRQVLHGATLPVLLCH